MLGLAISVSLLYMCYYRTLWPERYTSSLVTTEMNGKSNGVCVSNGRVADPAAGSPDPLKRNSVYLSMAMSREEIVLSYEGRATHLSNSEERRKFNTQKEIPFGQNPSQSRRQRMNETSYSADGSGSSSSLQKYGATAFS